MEDKIRLWGYFCIHTKDWRKDKIPYPKTAKDLKKTVVRFWNISLFIVGLWFQISVLIVVPSKEKPKVIMQHPKVVRQAESERLFKDPWKNC
jgi:hypothetical protein